MERHEDEIVIEGPKSIADATRAGWVPIALATREEPPAGLPEATTIRLGRSLFNALSDTSSSQGVLALFSRPSGSPETVFRDETRVVVALDGVQDPGNVGTIIRVAASFDAGGVVLLEGCADPWSQKAIRASAGTILGITIATMTTDEMLTAVRERRLDLFACVAHGEPDDRAEFAVARGVVVLGSEGRGVSAPILEMATAISIPMSEAVESLNVASAAAIILSRVYEARIR